MQVARAVDPVHDVQRAALAADLLLHPVAQPPQNAAASSVKPMPSNAYTENDPSRTQVYR